MKKVLSAFVLAFYIAIIMYVFFAVLHIDTLKNFVFAMAFEVIGFIALAYFIFGYILSRAVKIGYFVPLMLVTVVYTIILDAVNILLVSSVGPIIFTLINFILLFFYFMISVPMYLMGRR
jgi:hypothetical protein